MSPTAFVDTGAPESASDSRNSAPRFSFIFSGSGSIHQSNQENLEAMSNLEDLNAAFPSLGRINPVSEFNSAPFTRTSSGLTKPRLSKVRKQVKSQNLKPSGNSDSLPGPGFNPFHIPASYTIPSPGSISSVPVSGESGFGQSSSEAFVFGKNDGGLGENWNLGDESGKRVVDEMMKLNIQGGEEHGKDYSKGFSFDKNQVSKLPEDMQNLNIKDSQENMHQMGHNDHGFGFGAKNKSEFVFKGDENASSSSATTVEHELPNELNNKLRINAGKDSYSGFSSRNSGHVLHESMEKLNIKDKVIDVCVDQTQNAAVKAHEKVESRDNIGEKMLSDEMDKKLNIRNISPEGIKAWASSSKPFSKDSQKDNSVTNEHLNTKKVHDATSTSNNVEFNFLSKGTAFMEFKTAHSKSNPFSGLGQKLEFNSKKENAGATKSRRKGGKQAVKVQLNVGNDFSFSESPLPQGKKEVSEGYCPMDISPYEKTQCLEESAVSDQSSVPDKCHLSTSDASNDVFDEELLAATERMQINEGDEITTPEQGADFEDHAEDLVSGAESESFKSAAEEMEVSSDASVTAEENEVTSTFKSDRQESDDHHPSNLDSINSNFSFSASSSSGAHRPVSTSKRLNRLKTSAKHGHDPYNLVPNATLPYTSPLTSSSPLAGVQSLLSQGKEPLAHLHKPIHKSEAEKGREVRNESNAAQEACEKWRSRGNHAYTSGDLSKAEEFYTQGIDSVSRNETSRSCLRALMLCYSNRAATRMSRGRMREAITDCMMASAIDPNFLRVLVRAGNCYLTLGELEDASRYFKKCLQAGIGICVDRKIVVEASEGLQKAQRVSECMNEIGSYLQHRSSNSAEKALEVIEESLSICSYSEKLFEMKGEVLLMLGKYEEVIKLCEQTIDLAERNSLPLDSSNMHLANPNAHDLPKNINFRIWRCRFILKSYFRMGKLEEAIAFLEKQDQLVSVSQRDRDKSLESSIPFAATVRELLRLKAAGNEAFQTGRHSEAVEHYTAALSCNVESRLFTAVCFCNRAAAYKALGQIVDAIADCSLAIALDQNYSKAISRRATLFEMIRDYGQAANDVQRLVGLLTRQMEKASGASNRSMSLVNDQRQARLRLSELEEKSRRGIPLDMYLILGVERSCSASDIRKAYRKAALRHHPDKAGQSISRNDTKDDRVWKEIEEDVHKDADRLFKMIGEAYAILLDPAKRSEYDIEEEMHYGQKKRDGSSTSGGQSDVRSYHYYPFARNDNRRNWREVWRSQRESSAAAPPPRWSETARSNRYPL